MKYLQIVLSVVAAALVATAGAAMAGQVSVSPEGVSFLQALAGALLVLGYTPAVVTPAVGKTLAAISLVVTMAIGGHWAFLAHLEQIHPGVVTALHVIGFINAVVAFFSRGVQPPAVRPVASLDAPPPSSIAK